LSSAICHHAHFVTPRSSPDAEPIDLVYTWVDDQWPGYRDLLARYAADPHDRNPNRYRDNLELLKYSLRSVERHIVWAQHVWVVTCRPQAPAWLDPQAVRLVHHDEFMPASALPTFNSFAIVSRLHLIRGLSQRFVYIEDDCLFGAQVRPLDLFDADGRPRVFLKLRHAMAPDRRDDGRLSPWNRALAYSNQLLNDRYGEKRRRTVNHTPLPVDVASWRRMIDIWPEAFDRTAASRFRATGNVAPEHLYPHFLLEEGGGVEVDRVTTLRHAGYHQLNNIPLYQRISLVRLSAQRPMFCCMNDNYGQTPNPRAVTIVRDFLERQFPTPSRFERR